MNLTNIRKFWKKAFTLVEMLIVVVIIGILISALLPKLRGAQDKAADKKTQTAVRDYLIAQKASDDAYPLHLEDFSKKPYIADKKKDGSELSIASFKKTNSNWGAGSWIMMYDPTDAKNNPASDSGIFLKEVLSKINSQDMAQLTWKDNTIVGLGFFGNLAKLLQSGGADLTNDQYIKTLKNEGFTYIDKVNTSNPAKAVWGGFVIWLDKTPGNGWVKITDSTLIWANEELKDTYVNVAFVNDSMYFLKTILEWEEEKRKFMTDFLKAVNAVYPDLITNLTSGNS